VTFDAADGPRGAVDPPGDPAATAEARAARRVATPRKLRRLLRGEPLLARPASTGVRIAKFARRHRVGVATAAAVLALAAGLTAVYAVRLRHERDVARRESERARQVTAFLGQLLAGADPNKTRGATLTLRLFLAEAPPRVSAALADPRVRADVLHVIGEAQWFAGAQKDAIAPLTEALALREAELGREHPDTGRTLAVLGAAHAQIGEVRRGQVLLRRGIAVLEHALGPDAPDLVWPLDRLAVAVFEEDIPEAERLVERALRIHYAQGTPLSDRAFLLQHLAVFVRGRGDDRRGATLYLRSYEVSSQTLGPESPIAATALCNAARAFNELGESRRALAMQEKAQAIEEKAWGGDNVQLAGCLRAGAEIQVQLENLARARQLADAAYAMDRRLYGDDHMQTMNMVAVQAWVADAEGRVDDAVALYDRFIAFQKAAGVEENLGWWPSLLAYSRQKLARGDVAGAEADARKALALLNGDGEPDEASLIPALLLLGQIATAKGDAVEARTRIAEADRIARARLTPEQRDYRLATAALAKLGPPTDTTAKAANR
jgi:serine/threonine-protein kinase